jgi:glycosyltransferase involved in cell wall biosynthesis
MPAFNISVIIPAYNAEPYIEKAVESALQFKEVEEILIVEDGSPDKSYEICLSLARENSRVKLLQHPDRANHGASASRNLGLKQAKGKYVAFLDADDFYLKNRFDFDKEIFQESSNIDGVYNAVGIHVYSEKDYKDFQEGKSDLFISVKPDVCSRRLFEGMIGMAPSVGYFHLNGLTIKRKSLEKLDNYFIENLKVHQDTEFIIRLAYYCNLKGGILNHPVALRGIHKNNRITANNINLNCKIFNRIKLSNALYEWGKKNHVGDSIHKHLKLMKISREIPALPYFLRWLHLFRGIVFDRKIFLYNKYYDYYHNSLFGTNQISLFFLKLKYKLQNSANIKS